jgi:ribose transport system substrate-binding protein
VSGFNPMQVPSMENVFAVITTANAASFDLNDYMKGR